MSLELLLEKLKMVFAGNIADDQGHVLVDDPPIPELIS
jgi:hypothetical protein